ncbi:aconitase X catalytic domain-containing protein [Kribbella sp. NBC_01484]|uniref:aconitase X catalytic domain-containing protein n=1 Tax=Kribbella sp. NBC_01484 TaxID=2903579 RepID=UPI002E33BDC6|nr:aconitase X catalytic domain-containing protein [Kribbella sp. NBC_01484]
MQSLHLTAEEEAMLGGQSGDGVALAMRVIVAQARISDAPRLVEITSAHVDSCLYHGQVSLDFAHRLADLGAKVRVPTTLNVGSMDLLHPGLVRDRDLATAGRELMSAYVALGCAPTFTCAPYQLPNRPGLGEHVAWAESNAIVFANSVLGARTDRYGDFLDICAAITGRAPYSGLQTTEARRGTVVFDCRPLGRFLESDLAYPLLGHHVGSVVGAEIPVLVGIPADVGEDELKAFGAAAASAGGVALFHAVGVTPEAPTSLDGLPVHEVHLATLREVRRGLSTFREGKLDAVSVGTPHASYGECARLAELVGNGPALNVPFYLSTGRATRARAAETGVLQVLEAAGVTVVVDTCTYVTSILAPGWKNVMTNSGKWAHYAPGNINVSAVLGSLEECVASARAGRVVLDS